MKTTPAYVPQNSFEKLFEEAVQNPGARPKFLRDLFHFHVLVLGNIDKNPDGSETANFRIKMMPDESEAVLAFTSVDALQYVMTRESLPAQNYVNLRTFDLFKMLAGNMGLILNGGNTLKHFTASELAEILEDGPKLDTVTLSSNSTISIGQPAKVPTGLFSAMKTYLDLSPKLTDIYFGEYRSGKAPSTYLAVLEFDSPLPNEEIEPIVRDLMVVIQEPLGAQPMDITVADKQLRDLFQKGALISVRNT